MAAETLLEPDHKDYRHAPISHAADPDGAGCGAKSSRRRPGVTRRVICCTFAIPSTVATSTRETDASVSTASPRRYTCQRRTPSLNESWGHCAENVSSTWSC